MRRNSVSPASSQPASRPALGPSGGRSAPRPDRSRAWAAFWSLVGLLSLCALPGGPLRAAGEGSRAGSESAEAASGNVGVQWRDISLDEALKEAAEKDQLIMLEFWAAHCHSCGDMKEQVWDTEQGAKLADGLIPIKFDSVSPEGKEVSKRIPLTGLPCVIFLRPDGTEVDRVEGYTGPQQFFAEAAPLREGLDPLPGMEALLEEHPDSLQLMLNVMERYLFRKRVTEGEDLFQRILQADSLDRKGVAERAIIKMGRYQELVLGDYQKTLDTWNVMATRFPWCPSIGGAVDGAWKAFAGMGRYADWLDWICPILEKNPSQLSLQRSAVAIGLRGGYRSPCLAQAARASRNSFAGREAWYDSVAVVLEGGTGQR